MIMKNAGLKSVASDGFESPTVCVFYVKIPNIYEKFAQNGIQVAGSVPYQLDEIQPLKNFRIGLFGIDKLKNIDETIEIFEKALKSIL